MSFDFDDPRITAYVFGELDEQQRAAFEAELDQSGELREAVQQTQATLDQLTSELQSEPQMAMSDTQRQSVAKEIQRVSASDAKPQLATDIQPISEIGFSKRKWVALAAVAASLLLVCGLAYMYNLGNGGWRVAATPDRGDSSTVTSESSSASTEELGMVRDEFEEYDDIELSSEGVEASDFGTPAGDVSAHEASQLADGMVPPVDAYASSVAGGDPMESTATPQPNSSFPVQQGRAGYDSENTGSGGMLDAFVQDEGQFLNLVEDNQQVLKQKMQTEVEQQLNEARDQMRQNPEDAKRNLKLLLETVERSPDLDPETRAPLRDQAASAIREAGRRAIEASSRRAMAEENRAAAEERQRLVKGADAYGRAGGYGAAGGHDSFSVAPPVPAAAPAPGQLAAGAAPYGGAGGGMGGGGYGGDTSYGRAYGMQREYGPTATTDFAMSARGGYLGSQPGEAAPALSVQPPDSGTGPRSPGDRYEPIVENQFQKVTDHPLSTFSIDVDTASYSKVRMHLLQNNRLPRPDAVRIEELVNYFTYDYQPPEDDVPFAAHIEVADCPWTPGHRLVRFGIKGQEMDREERPTSNLVFLLDVSGSMSPANKLPLVKQGMKMLVDQLGENDRVAIAVYAGAAGLVLDSTTGDHKQVILDSLDRLHAGGSTNGGQGIRLAYQTALDNFVGGGVNRVILCTDGDFNVGTTGTDELVRLAEENAKTGVFLSVLGFGMGNHNDSMLEQVSNKGNGNYAFIDNQAEARKVLVEEMMGTLVTIAKDVKIQVEFNPAEVSAYRLIGYENRILAAEDFNDDKKDAGEIGAGHTVTALYEVVPAGSEPGVATSPVDDLRYQSETKLSKAAKTGEMLTLKMRYKQPDGDTSALLTFPVEDEGNKFGQASQDFRFAAAVASFGMLLRNSQHLGNATYAGVLETATEAASGDTSGYRGEFLKMIERAKQLSGQ